MGLFVDLGSWRVTVGRTVSQRSVHLLLLVQQVLLLYFRTYFFSVGTVVNSAAVL